MLSLLDDARRGCIISETEVSTLAKYLIKASIEVDGIVEKPDVIGAIFGQTEGLLGEDFDLRELQEKGRIGRIQVDLKVQGTRTVGEVIVPSNLDRVETALVAAMIEAVERVGPYNAKIKVTDIIDVRMEKIKKIVERAKQILQTWTREKSPDVKEILREISEATKRGEVIEYGPEKLPAGPDVDKADTIIIVEGRADVINLLRYGYRNVIALEGATGKIPETIVKLCKQKKAIAFLDGDHGGDLILKELLKAADIDYIARAPPGKEVEELTGKEIAKALKSAVPVQQYLAAEKEKKEAAEPKVVTLTIPNAVIDEAKKLQGTLEAILYDKDWNALQRVPVRDLVDTLAKAEDGKVYAVVFDGVITQRLVDTAASKGVKLLIGAKIGGISKRPFELQLLSFNDIL